MDTFDSQQRLVITQGQRGFQLFINGNLQFSSSDEFIYHESLVHPLLCCCDRPSIKHVAILGGGDGLAAREVLRYLSVISVTVVDHDPVITWLASENKAFRSLNAGSFGDPRVTVVNADAIEWLKADSSVFDAIVVDFPDPQWPDCAELYTRSVFIEIARRLAKGAHFVIQATSRQQCPRSFWCINRTIEAAGFSTVQYDVSMPSFGEWSFIIGHQTLGRLRPRRKLPKGLTFLTDAQLPPLQRASRDPAPSVNVNEDESLTLFHYFDEEWREWVREHRQ